MSNACCDLTGHRAVDDSMAPTIRTGDRVLCDPAAPVTPGDVVVVRSQGTVICGRWHPATSAGIEVIELRFDNLSVKPLVLALDAVEWRLRAVSVSAPTRLL